MTRGASNRPSPAVAQFSCATMKKATLPLLIGLIALTGCARHYVMKLSNGSEITTATKPRLKEGIYHFKDAKGEEHFVPTGRVREIAPASVVDREYKPQPIKAPSEKHRKWYLLWLG
jgi:Bacterial protein of unknown function (DUF903)